MKFYSKLAKGITPYKAGEQPIDKKYIKLNTNENPYPPAPKVMSILNSKDYEDLRLYPDPECTELKEALSKVKNIDKSKIFVGNGSDEVLSMCFAAFLNPDDTLVYADITYSFYEVYASYYNLKSKIIPLRNFRIEPKDYVNLECNGIIIANPNAPTGDALTQEDMEYIIKNNKERIVIVDQAYIAFCQYDITDLINTYDNLVVVETLSKSHSLAGIRCGFAYANENLIAALNRIKNSINSYTVNRISIKVASQALYEVDYYKEISDEIIATRQRIYEEITQLGLFAVPSQSNFLFIKLNNAEQVYLQLKNRGILVRYFNRQGINDFIRVTVGKDEDMDIFIKELKSCISKKA